MRCARSLFVYLDVCVQILRSSSFSLRTVSIRTVRAIVWNRFMYKPPTLRRRCSARHTRRARTSGHSVDIAMCVYRLRSEVSLNRIDSRVSSSLEASSVAYLVLPYDSVHRYQFFVSVTSTPHRMDSVEVFVVDRAVRLAIVRFVELESFESLLFREFCCVWVVSTRHDRFIGCIRICRSGSIASATSL